MTENKIMKTLEIFQNIPDPSKNDPTRIRKENDPGKVDPTRIGPNNDPYHNDPTRITPQPGPARHEPPQKNDPTREPDNNPTEPENIPEPGGDK